MHANSAERRRALARVLHESPRVDPRFASLHVMIVLYRDRAAQLFKRLVELEAKGDDKGAGVRRALIECSDRIETLAALVGAPAPRDRTLEWLDEPTLPRR